jgi:hypothetical protein
MTPTYTDLVVLAKTCAKHAHQTARRDVAMEYWRLALGYQANAARCGEQPDIGAPPPWLVKD